MPFSIRCSPSHAVCTLPLYDGEYSAEELGGEDKIKMGEIRFRLTVDVGADKISPKPKENIERDQTTPPNRKTTPEVRNSDPTGRECPQSWCLRRLVLTLACSLHVVIV